MDPDHYRRCKYGAAVLLTILFVAVVLIHEHHTRRYARERIRAHADIVSDALWNLNPGGSAAYLSLACKSDDYAEVTVFDLQGREFQHIDAGEKGAVDDLLQTLKLIPRVDLLALIRHDHQVIGTIKALWDCKTVYFDVTVFVVLLLVYLVVKLNFRLIKGKQMLENRVVRRTRKLSDVNRRLSEAVDDQERSRSALVDSEERYRTFFEENIAASYISTPEGHLVACNEAFVRMFGFPDRQTAMETPLSEVFYHSVDRDRFLEDLRRNHRVSSHETRYRKQDGSDLYLIENASAVRDAQGVFYQIRGFLIDVSEVRALESQLLQACKMETIGRMAGSIAHDFNNFLFPIVGYCELMMQDHSPDHPDTGKIREIHDCAKKAGELVNRILTFSRQEVRDVKPICFKAVVVETLELIQALAPVNVNICKDLPDGDMVITADAGQIQQVVMNLLTNACQAMEPGGGNLAVGMTRVDLAGDGPDMATDPGPYACLWVSDTGPGIDAAIREKMFEPFFTTKEKGKGTGLGLSIVQSVVKALGGSVVVQLPEKGGTCFKVYLPLDMTAAAGRISRVDSADPALGTEHIVLVDDDTAIVSMLTQILERLGYSVSPFTQSLDVPPFVQAHRDQVDLVISDMSMPDMCGDELARMLQDIKPGLPVMICTGFGDTLSGERTREMGISAVLMKPVSMDKLSSAIRQVLDPN